jgi:frataxin-like iron-binding protein CyaY
MAHTHYFKWVALREDDPDWYEQEVKSGRARFGWSGPGSDLRPIKKKMDEGHWADRTPIEIDAWRAGSYLIKYIEPGSRLVIQTRSPLRSFWLAEVTGPYEFDGTQDDFNHVFSVKLAAERPIPIFLKEVTPSLRHDISKRTSFGHYQIYPTESVDDLNRIWMKLQKGSFDFKTERTDADTFEEMRKAITESIFKNISKKWKAKYFELFCEEICNNLDHVEVAIRADTHQGWDMQINIYDPITGTLLESDVPVQCKNYTGKVYDLKPIDDLANCITNSKKDRAYLFILGELTEEFKSKLREKQEELSTKLGVPIKLELVDQKMIAELYQQAFMRRDADYSESGSPSQS